MAVDSAKPGSQRKTVAFAVLESAAVHRGVVHIEKEKQASGRFKGDYQVGSLSGATTNPTRGLPVRRSLDRSGRGTLPSGPCPKSQRGHGRQEQRSHAAAPQVE